MYLNESIELQQKVQLEVQEQEVSCTHCGSIKTQYKTNYIHYERYLIKDDTKCYYFCKHCSLRFVGLKQGQEFCPRCKYDNFVYHEVSCDGKPDKDKSRYICNDCGRSFIGPKYKGKHYKVDPESEYQKDVWDLRCLGVEAPPASSKYKLKFEHLLQPWLRQAAKLFIRHVLIVNSSSEAFNKLMSLKRFSRFIFENYSNINPQDINRTIILKWLEYLSRQSYNVRIKGIVHINQFFELCQRSQWLDLIDKPLIYKEDYPGKQPRPTPRDIPHEVVEQVSQNLEKLPEPYMRMILVIQETGMRVAELCLLQFNCLRQDNHGDWFLNYHQFKMKKDHSVPISRELVAVIQEQQAFIAGLFETDFEYLFCSRNVRTWLQRPMGTRGFADIVNRFGKENNICDVSGQLWKFQTHQFRHTVGTSMINRGVPIHIVQRYLGHETPEMTLRYARIYDQTLKEEVAKFQGKVVNIAGQVLESQNPEFDTADLQWFKRNIQAQALPNGSCALPAPMKECPHANACLTCAHFRTTFEFLEHHQEQLQQTEKLLEKAQLNGWTRQVEMNERVAKNLRTIISSLEAKDDHRS
jgi:integrase/recombinase XerD